MNSLNNNNQCHYPTKQEQQEPACLWSTPSTPSCSDMSSPQSPSATETNPDYAVYHVPKGYDVLLVPKPDEPNPESSIDDPSSDCAFSQTSSKPMDIPKTNKPNNDTTSTATTTSTRLSAYRKRKADKNYIPRPKNCFMAYREHIKEKFLAENPGLNNKVVSVLAADMWNNEPESIKEIWRDRAKQLKMEHKIKYPDYKFKPQKKKQNLKTPNGTKTPSKTIRKKTLGSDKHMVFSDGCTAEMMGDSDEGKLMYAMPLEGAEEQEEMYMNMPHFHKKIFGHYRASSVDSVSSWTSDSTASTPLLSPFVGSPASLSPPSFPLSRSSSALRYEAGNVPRINNEGPHGNVIMTPHNLAIINEVDQLNQMYNQMDVNVRATLPVDDGFVLDSSSPSSSYDESSLRATSPFFNQPFACSTTQPEMSTTDYDLMAMGHFGSPIPEEEGFYVDYNSVDAYQGFNSSYDLSSQGSTSSLAEHYALTLETPRRNSQQSLVEFQQNMRHQELVLQGLLVE